ncbi:Ras-related protein Rab-9B [Trichoplax sp. H2]|nr:Ras-related protein Rab-9B [Trichoplax sp. H2]|eukprot:RDD45978.1 Ras-related protein Rab-9B [Trichoplax sp. H2]
MANDKAAILLKVILLGDGGVGKSSLMTRFIQDKFDENSYHTIGVEFLSKNINVNGITYTIQIWDTAGQERYRSLRTPFYRGADCCLLTFALDNRNSFDNLATWRKEFIFYADVNDPETFPFVVLGNKVDIQHEQRQIHRSEAEEWCYNNYQMPYLETSAKDSTNVEVAFVKAIEKAVKLEEKVAIKTDFNSTIDLTKCKGRNNKNNSCCT